MASVAGRKKSIVSTTGLQIDTTANNTLLNKSASQSTSLYQQCSALRSRLMRIRGFSPYFSLSPSPDSRRSTDPVTQLWDLFSTGTPLCYVFDQLPEEAGFNKINNSSFDTEQYEANPDRVMKRAIALFAMQIREEKVAKDIPGCEPFTVTDLWDRNSTDGLVKVINTVTAIVDHLPPDAFEDDPPSPPSLLESASFDSLPDTLASTPANAQESARNNIIKETVETERKYVQDLEIMQKYATALSQANLMDQDTIHLLFPVLNKLVNFQRKFLIRLEGIAELPWAEQRWGLPFIESEDEFVVYEPYCSNYTNAVDIMLTNEQNLTPLNHMINFKGELPGLLIKPIQRICKYPLLLNSLVKACSESTCPYYEELKKGEDAAKRITDKTNEAQRRVENEQTVKLLQARVEDWKGHHLENFGDLLLDSVFVVTKSDIDREYHVFLFEKIILCCKEAVAQPSKGAKGQKQNASLLKKQAVPPALALPGGVGKVQKDTPLLLKGRIFLGNVTQAIPVPARASPTLGIPTHYPLAVWWKGDDDLEFFTLRCRREDQMRQWEATINRLIKEAAQRRATERNGISRVIATVNSSSHSRIINQPPHQAQPHSHMSQISVRHRPSITSAGPQGNTPHDGFDPDYDDDESEDASSSYTPYGSSISARTPAFRRGPNAHSLPPERESNSISERPRAQTEGGDGPVMAQWRTNGQPPVPIPVQSANGIRPTTSRLYSTTSVTSYASDASFGSIISAKSNRPLLRSQYSSTRLRNGFDSPSNGQGPSLASGLSSNGSDYRDYRDSGARSATPTLVAPPLNRSRSASQPQAYIPPQSKSGNPPMVPAPSANQPQWNNRDLHQHRLPNGLPGAAVSEGNSKRESGSSQSTESSNESPKTTSPITPFGSSESSLGVGMIIPPRLHGYGQPKSHTTAITASSLPVKVKVHFHEDIFVIQVPRSTEYADLVEKVGRKIRLCGPRRDDGPLRVKYRDEDGDMISLGSTEDVQMAFEQYRPGGQVTLFVT